MVCDRQNRMKRLPLKLIFFISLFSITESLCLHWLWSVGALYLVVVYQVENQVYISMNWLVLSHLWFNSIEPVNERLQSICKLAREQQGLFQLILSGKNKSLSYWKASSNSASSVTSSYWDRRTQSTYFSIDLPQTVSHLSLSSLSMSSSFWLSSWREVLSFKARPVREVVSYTECLLPRAFWNSWIRKELPWAQLIYLSKNCVNCTECYGLTLYCLQLNTCVCF